MLVTRARRLLACLVRDCPSAPFGRASEFPRLHHHPNTPWGSYLDDQYAAGLFDGEGYIRINRWEKPNSNHVRYQLFGGIGMTFKPVIDLLQQTYGGSLHVNRHSERNANHRDQFGWIVASQTAATFLRRVLPYLIVKRDEAEIALEVQASIDEWKFKLGNRGGFHPDRDKVFAHRKALAARLFELKHRSFSTLTA